jgi:hypothetical protein
MSGSSVNANPLRERVVFRLPFLIDFFERVARHPGVAGIAAASADVRRAASALRDLQSRGDDLPFECEFEFLERDFAGGDGESNDQVRRADYCVHEIVNRMTRQRQMPLEVVAVTLITAAAALFTRDLRQHPEHLETYRFALQQLGDELALASVPPTAQGN